MTSRDRGEFRTLMARLFITFPAQRSVEEVALATVSYWEALQDDSLEEVAAAVRAAIRTPGRRWLPTPGELVEEIVRARRERRAATTPPALPPAPEPTQDEIATVRRLLDGLYAKLGAGRGAPMAAVECEPTAEELATHHRWRARVARDFRRGES